MPGELLERINQFADGHGYTGRSEVLREAGRNLLGEFENEKLEGRELMGVATVVLDYETTSVEEKVMRLRHEHEGIVASNVHSHVGGRHCMELVRARGVSRGDIDVRPEGLGDEGHLHRRLLRATGGRFRPAGRHGLIRRCDTDAAGSRQATSGRSETV